MLLILQIYTSIGVQADATCVRVGEVGIGKVWGTNSTIFDSVIYHNDRSQAIGILVV